MTGVLILVGSWALIYAMACRVDRHNARLHAPWRNSSGSAHASGGWAGGGGYDGGAGCDGGGC